jgi:Ribonuclease P
VFYLLQPLPGLAGSPPAVGDGSPEVVGQSVAAAKPGVVGSPAGVRGGAPVQAGFGAGSRHFKKAVDRNRIKRLCREAYRLQKQPLLEQLKKKEHSLAVFFIYTGKELPDYRTVSDKIGVLLLKLVREFE